MGRFGVGLTSVTQCGGCSVQVAPDNEHNDCRDEDVGTACFVSLDNVIYCWSVGNYIVNVIIFDGWMNLVMSRGSSSSSRCALRDVEDLACLSEIHFV